MSSSSYEGPADPAHQGGGRAGAETPPGSPEFRTGYAPDSSLSRRIAGSDNDQVGHIGLSDRMMASHGSAFEARDASSVGGRWRDAPHSNDRSGWMLRAVALVTVPAAAVVGLDQLTKWMVRQQLGIGERWPSEPVAGVFSITHVANTGVAFGLFQGNSRYFIVLAAVVVIALIFYLGRLPRHASATRFAVGLQIGGAIGNLLDRIRIGHVTDFIDLQYWPVFNVADSAIVVGVLILAWELWKEEREQTAAEVLAVDSG